MNSYPKSQGHGLIPTPSALEQELAVCGLCWNGTSEIGNIGNKNLAFGTVVAPIGQLQLAYEDAFN